jgi:hypothetical protein
VNIVAWILQIVLAVAFRGAGGMKLARPRPALVSSGMGFAEDYTDTNVKLIGAIEVIGAIVPWLAGIDPILTPLAALGLALVVAGAVVVHIRRKEAFIPPLVLGVLSLVVAVLRFASSQRATGRTPRLVAMNARISAECVATTSRLSTPSARSPAMPREKRWAATCGGSNQSVGLCSQHSMGPPGIAMDCTSVVPTRACTSSATAPAPARSVPPSRTPHRSDQGVDVARGDPVTTSAP